MANGDSLANKSLGECDRFSTHSIKVVHHIFEFLARFSILKECLGNLLMGLVPLQPELQGIPPGQGTGRFCLYIGIVEG